MAKPGLTSRGCQACGQPLPPQTRGRPRKYCTDPECIAANGRSDRRRLPCSICGTPTKGGTGSKGEDRTCSTCRQAGHGDTRPLLTITCQQCQQPFTTKTPGRKYCGQRCSWLAFKATHPAEPADLTELKRLIRKYPDEAEDYVTKVNKRRAAERDRQKTRDRTGVVGREWEKARAKVKARREPCWICGHPIDWDAAPRTRWSFSVDHVIPRSKGGDPYAQSNLRTAHYGCNASKGNGTKRMRKAPRPRPEPIEERW